MRRARRSVRPFYWTVIVESLRGENVVGETELHGLCAIGDGASADRRDEIGTGSARLLRRGDHGAPRCVSRHLVEHTSKALVQCTLDVIDLVGAAVQGPARHQKDATRIEAAGDVGK